MRLPSPEPRFSPAHAGAIVAAWAIVLAAIAIFAHATPLYFVETRLVGEHLPNARAILDGRLDLAYGAFREPGYPLLVALFAWPLGGDVALAAKLVSAIAMALSAWLGFAIARRAAGETAAAMALAILLTAPALVRWALEAGTDAPALALLLASTALVLAGGGARRALAAGALAAFAVLTRGDALFLVPCALIVILGAPSRGRRLLAYAAGFAGPIALWIAFATRAGGLPHDRSFLGVAWELYGDGVPWDQFERTIGARFHSLFDVFAFDPGRAAARVATNLFVHRALDARDLVTPALALLALPGLVLLSRRAPGRAWIRFAAACAFVLAFVSYDARLALFLLPLYAAGAGAAIAWAWRRTTAEPPMRWPGAVRAAIVALAGVIVADGAATAALDGGARLAAAPEETRAGGQAIARLAAGGGAIVARRPHAAYFAGRAFVPLPDEVAPWTLAAYARGRDADWVFYSPIELAERPELGVLADSGVSLPGLEPVLWRRLDERRFYAVYRVAERPDTTGFAAAYRGALRRHEEQRPRDASAALFVALRLLELGDAEGALARLDRLEATGASQAQLARHRSTALLALGRLDEAEKACRAAMALEPTTVWHWSRLGDLAARQERWNEAASFFERASALQPTNASVLERLGRCRIAEGEAVRAADAFERALVLEPVRADLRRLAMGAWQLAGNAERMKELYDEGISLGATPRDLLGTDPPPEVPARRRIQPARND
jgi:Flp pilus assembly protein TadD